MFLFKYFGESSSKTSNKNKDKEKKKKVNTMKIEKQEEKEDKLCCLGLPSSSSSCNNQVSNYCKSRETSTRACRSNFAQTTTSSLFPNTHFTSHMSLPSFSEAFSAFILTFPKYMETQKADSIRLQNYPHLSNHVSFDYTGFSLFDYHGNSNKASSSSSSSCLRHRIVDFVNISEEGHTMVCTANKASSFKLVAETYPFSPKKTTLLTAYDHDCEAVCAMKESATKRGAKVVSACFSWPNLRINSVKLKKALTGKKKGLFVFPLQSRMSGARYAYFWMRMAQENGWDVLLDACGLGPKDMDCLGLSFIHPDFIVCSFHHVFGLNPSGFSTLFVRNSSSSFSSTIDRNYVLHDHHDEEEEEENVEYKALDYADSLGLLLIGSRMRYITNWLVVSLMKLKHPSDLSLVRIYGPKVRFERGNAIAFNVYDWKGDRVEPELVQKLADRSSISLGCGFLTNIWFSEKYEEEKKHVLEKRKDDEEDLGIKVVNASVGFMANFEDVYKLWCFVAKFLDADFVEKERWRYMTLNQKMIEV